VTRERSLEVAHPGSCGGGDYNFEIGQARFQGPNELRADVYLADADRMQPEDMAVGNCLLEFWVVIPEPLQKTCPPASPTPKAPKVIRGGENEQNPK
jgi:hypothetical protein